MDRKKETFGASHVKSGPKKKQEKEYTRLSRLYLKNLFKNMKVQVSEDVPQMTFNLGSDRNR